MSELEIQGTDDVTDVPFEVLEGAAGEVDLDGLDQEILDAAAEAGDAVEDVDPTTLH